MSEALYEQYKEALAAGPRGRAAGTARCRGGRLS